MVSGWNMAMSGGREIPLFYRADCRACYRRLCRSKPYGRHFTGKHAGNRCESRKCEPDLHSNAMYAGIISDLLSRIDDQNVSSNGRLFDIVIVLLSAVIMLIKSKM